MAEKYSIVCIYPNLFIHSSVNRCLVASTLWLLWIVLQWTWCSNIWVSTFSSFEYMPTNRIAGSYGNSMFTFLRNFQLFSASAALFLFHQQLHENSHLFCFCFCCLCFWYQIQKITAKVDVKDESLNFDEVQFIYFFLLSMPLMSYLENAAKLWRFIVFMWLYVCICLCNLVYKV